MSNGVDQGVHTTHRNNDIVNLSNEDYNVLRFKRFLHPLWCKLLHLEMGLYFQVLIPFHQALGHANCIASKTNLQKVKKEDENGCWIF
jgi:hypothetical protein